MLVLNENIGAFNSFAESLKSHNLYLIGHTAYVFTSYQHTGHVEQNQLNCFHLTSNM